MHRCAIQHPTQCLFDRATHISLHPYPKVLRKLMYVLPYFPLLTCTGSRGIQALFPAFGVGINPNRHELAIAHVCCFCQGLIQNFSRCKGSLRRPHGTFPHWQQRHVLFLNQFKHQNCIALNLSARSNYRNVGNTSTKLILASCLG